MRLWLEEQTVPRTQTDRPVPSVDGLSTSTTNVNNVETLKETKVRVSGKREGRENIDKQMHHSVV